MSDYLDVLMLPDLAKEKIFTYLEGRSLHAARRVCKSWNTYIIDGIWNQKTNRNELERTMEANWRKPDYHFAQEWIDAPYFFPGYVVASSSELVAIRTYLNIRLQFSRIAIYNVVNNNFFEIQSPFNNVYQMALYNQFKACLSDSLLGLRVPLRGDYRGTYHHTENLQVFSMISREKLVDENVQYLQGFEVVKTPENSELMVLFIMDNVQLWSFKADGNITKIQVPADRTNFSSASFNFPYVLQTVYHPANDMTQVTVWTIDKEPLTFTKKFEIPNIDDYFNDNKGNRLKFRIDQMMYVNEGFLICCEVKIEGALVERSQLCLRSFDNNGLLLRQFNMSSYSYDAYVTLIKYEKRIIITADDDVLIFNGNVEKLFNPDPAPVIFKRIPNLSGSSEPLIRKVEATTFSLLDFHCGFQMMKISTLNFWKRN